MEIEIHSSCEMSLFLGLSESPDEITNFENLFKYVH